MSAGCASGVPSQPSRSCPARSGAPERLLHRGRVFEFYNLRTMSENIEPAVPEESATAVKPQPARRTEPQRRKWRYFFVGQTPDGGERQRPGPTQKIADQPHWLTLLASSFTALSVAAAFAAILINYRVTDRSLRISQRAVEISERNLMVGQRAYLGLQNGFLTHYLTRMHGRLGGTSGPMKPYTICL